ncbi:hypothetical protein CCU68_35190 [Pseudomonas gingeri NCPPB 3146 = LMG 5327]|uniref:Uncharacterized protein n=2 Tax=Pseudomonas gingeri TaxID=117681 RepID=A0A7Y8CGZ6_9PSED|nr:hypothetical protein [Pseudomonas gingeri]NWC18730.1 hypothetical protein [Pseudomonas gingeri]PNQ87813.1 hypothetical protein CCU68_35190 [Pseudomonas gingeri NCPPB 3146 = LMG 5327]
MNTHTQFQTTAPIFHNWLTADDFLAFAKGISKPMTSNIDDMKAKVDAIFSDACKRGSTYETVVHNFFCAGVEGEFGTDETAPEFAEVFMYAREYGYMNATENAAREQADAENGYCHHGLDAMTCPCGCFEFDGAEEEQEIYIVPGYLED